MNEHRYTAFNALVDIIAAPAKAFDNIKEHTAWLWWPLLLSILLGVGSAIAYHSWVDYPWLIEQTISALPANAPPEQAEQVRSFMSPTTSIIFGSVAIVIITFLIYLIQSVYLHLANKVSTGAEISFGQWFSFSAWTAFVGIFNAIAVFVVILMADNNQVGQHEILPLSMNQLFIHANPGDAWFTWGSSLTLFNIWTLVLMAIGYARWTSVSLVKSTVITWLPWVALFGIWAAMI